jgi:putative ABC transport system substrate-binding protein
MRRRDFVALIGAVGSWPIGAWGQRNNKIPRVGVLWHAGSAKEEGTYFRALLEGLNALGYIDGETISFEHRFPNEVPDRFLSLAAELAALKVDVLPWHTSTALACARRASVAEGRPDLATGAGLAADYVSG